MRLDDFPVDHCRHVDAPAAFGINEFDGLGHCVGFFTSVLERFERQTTAVHVQVLRPALGRHRFVAVRSCDHGSLLFDRKPSIPIGWCQLLPIGAAGVRDTALIGWYDGRMDMVTLYAIHALANGTPRTWQRQVPAHVCVTVAHKTRVAYPQTVIWCRSELEPRRFADELPVEGEYVPDAMDMLGMPGDRDGTSVR